LQNDRLAFENAAVSAGVADAPEGYTASWFHFDNTTGETRPLAATSSHATTIAAPAGLPTKTGSFVAIDLSANSRAYPNWMRPVRTYFRLDADGWKLVGLERMSDGPAELGAQRHGTH
jgi:hypothetical protein